MVVLASLFSTAAAVARLVIARGERPPLASAFKLLAVGAALRRVHAGPMRLDEWVRFGRRAA